MVEGMFRGGQIGLTQGRLVERNLKRIQAGNGNAPTLQGLIAKVPEGSCEQLAGTLQGVLEVVDGERRSRQVHSVEIQYGKTTQFILRLSLAPCNIRVPMTAADPLTSAPDIRAVVDYFGSLQQNIVAAIEAVDPGASFGGEALTTPEGGISRPRVVEGGDVVEKGAVQFTHSLGAALPPAATERNPHLAGQPFQAVAVSVIFHPCNPYAPTSHFNIRFFLVEAEEPWWHFGGGFDLTPVYAFDEDCIEWHRVARDAVGDHYPSMKAACDEYFTLSHRQEARGIGGLFFDDWREGGFGSAFDLVRRVGDSYMQAYIPILKRRKDMPFGDRERDFQLYRRGRYAEFNLAIDRGTRYGIQSGRRIEAVLASLPPEVRWRYNWQPEPGSPEAALSEYLQPRDWL